MLTKVHSRKFARAKLSHYASKLSTTLTEYALGEVAFLLESAHDMLRVTAE